MSIDVCPDCEIVQLAPDALQYCKDDPLPATITSITCFSVLASMSATIAVTSLILTCTDFAFALFVVAVLMTSRSSPVLPTCALIVVAKYGAVAPVYVIRFPDHVTLLLLMPLMMSPITVNQSRIQRPELSTAADFCDSILINLHRQLRQVLQTESHD